MLRAVVGEEARDLGLEGDGVQVEQEKRDTHRPIDHAEEEVAMTPAQKAGGEQRDAEEKEQRAGDGDRHGDTDGVRAQLDLLGGGLDVRRPHQRLHAEVELFPQPGQAAHKRQLPEGMRIDDGAQSLAQDLDLAVGLADRDGVGGAAAHHDALEHGLAAVEELLLAHSRAHASPCLTPRATLATTG